MAGVVGKNFGRLPTELLGMNLPRFRTLTLNAMILNNVREKDPSEMSVAEKVRLRQAHTGMSQYMRRYENATTRD